MNASFRAFQLLFALAIFFPISPATAGKCEDRESKVNQLTRLDEATLAGLRRQLDVAEGKTLRRQIKRDIKAVSARIRKTWQQNPMPSGCRS